MDLEQLKVIAAGGGWPAVGIVVVFLLVWLWKSDLIPWELPVRARPFVALGMGQVSSLLELLFTGMSFKDAVLHGLLQGAGAIALHEAGSKLTRKDKDLTGGGGMRGNEDSRISVVVSSGSDMQRSARTRLYGAVISAGLLAFSVQLGGCNMTPAQQAQTALDVVEAGIEIGDAVCERNGSAGTSTGAKVVGFLCKVVDVANTLRNTSSKPGEVNEPTYGEPFQVYVAPELADAFEAKYRAAPLQ